MQEQVDKKAELGLQPNDTKWRNVELDFFFEIRVRRVVGTQDGQRPIRDALQQCVDVSLRAQRRIHFVVRVEILDRFVG